MTTKLVRIVCASALIALGVLGPAVEAVEPRPQVVIAFDASGSMAGERLQAARSATVDFVRSIPVDVKVGLVVFSTDARIRVPLTFNRNWLIDAIKAIEARGNTALYDALATSLDALRGVQAPHIVVLSDGSDTTSSTSFDAIKQRAAKAGTPLSIIALKPERQHRQDLQVLANVSGGRVIQHGGKRQRGFCAGFVDEQDGVLRHATRGNARRRVGCNAQRSASK
jgi:Mg-chelatase subunit ChlD